MVIICKGSVEEFVRKKLGKMSLMDRIDFNLYGTNYND